MVIKALLSSGGTEIVDAGRWQEQREDILVRIYSVIGSPPVSRDTRAFEILGEERLASYVRCRVRYLVGEGDPIAAYLLVPHDAVQPAAAVVAMHQTVDSGKDEVVGLAGCPDFAYGHELACRGYVILAPDYLTAGERACPGEECYESGPFYDHYPTWSIVGKNVEDSKAAVDVLCTLRWVDETRIGVVGHSLGGHNAIFAMALDDRIRVGVSSCGMSVFSEEEERLEWSLEEGYVYIPSLREKFLSEEEAPFDLNEVAALIAPRPWLNISSYYDAAYGNQEFLAQVGVQLNQVYRLYDMQSAFSYLMHGSGHSFPEFARSLSYSWLDRFLR